MKIEKQFAENNKNKKSIDVFDVVLYDKEKINFYQTMGTEIMEKILDANLYVKSNETIRVLLEAKLYKESKKGFLFIKELWL